MNPIDAKTSMIINIVAAILTGVAAGAVSFKGLVAPDTAAQITGWSAIFAFVISCVNVGLHGYSSPGAGPMVPPLPPPAGKIAAWLLAIGLSALAAGWSSPARAQASNRQAPLHAAPLTGDPIRDIGNAIGGQKPAALNEPEDIAAKIRALSLPDFKYAAALAHATGNAVSAPCWDMWVKLITAQQQPLTDPATGQPMAEPDPHLFTSIERLSEAIHQLLPESDLSVACAPLAQAAKKDVGVLIGSVLSGSALSLFKLPIPIP
jgi:hypothetical protein